jgi:DMSO/TMAO reductase YedYZ molybdopterin-dependent catalytic subunit
MNPVRFRLRRRLFFRAVAGAGAVALAGCDKLSRTEWFPKFLGNTEVLTRKAQRALMPRKSMAQEFPESARSPEFRSNGTAIPDNPQYKALAAAAFATYRLEVGGLVDKPGAFSLEDLRAMPSRTQITRHDCVEGWSAIGKWKGVPLTAVLERVLPTAAARYVVFHCADPM